MFQGKWGGEFLPNKDKQIVVTASTDVDMSTIGAFLVTDASGIGIEASIDYGASVPYLLPKDVIFGVSGSVPTIQVDQDCILHCMER